MIEFVSSLKDTQIGSIPGWGLLFAALGFWWKGLPNLIEAWEKRSSGIETRLKASMDAYIIRNDAEMASMIAEVKASKERHNECEERAQKQNDRINHLEKEIIGFQRQIAAQDIAAAGHLNLDATPATKAMVEKMKVVK